MTSVRTIESPSPVASSSRNPDSTPRPLSTTARCSWPSAFDSCTTTDTSGAALWEPVIDSVLQELGEHDRQRRGDRRRDPTAVALHGEPHRPVDRLQALLGEPQQRPHDLDERHVVARLARKRFVHERDRADPSHRVADGGDRLGMREPAGLQPQQRRDRLQVVLHPVVDLADRGVLAEQQAIALAQLADVAHQQHGTGDLARRRRVDSRNGTQRHSKVTPSPCSNSSITGTWRSNA